MKYKLSEVMDLIGGGTPKTSKTEYWNGDIPWLSVKDFNNGFRYVYETEKSITQLGLENSSTKLLQKGDVIISARGTVGEIATIPFPMAFNQSCYGLRAKSGIVTSDYLYYLIKHNVSVLKKNTHGSVFDTITRSTFDNIVVEIPSIEIQEKIASILSDYDEKIELNNAINNNLEQQAALLFDENYSNNNYNISTLEAVATIKYGKGLPTKKLTAQGFPVFGGNGVIGRYTHFMYEEPQVLVSCRGAASGKIMESYPNSFVTNNSLILEWNDYRYYEFYKQFLLANPLNSYATGSAQPQITIDNIKNVPIPYPNYDEISELCLTLKSISSLHYENVIENNKLANLRDTLLPHLMSGELDVSDIDI